MSVTAVVTRSDAGMPMTVEIYESGVRYLIDSSGNLEIISAERQSIGLYGSGNWLSVFIDDAVECKPWENPPPSEIAADVGEAAGGYGYDDSDGVEILPPLTPGRMEPPPAIRSPAAAASSRTATGTDPSKPKPSAKPRKPSLPPGMMPVAFAPRQLRRPTEAPKEPAGERFTMVSFPAKALKPRPPDPPPERGPKFQVVSFGRSYSAKGQRIRPAPVDDPEDSDEEPNDHGGVAPEAS